MLYGTGELACLKGFKPPLIDIQPDCAISLQDAAKCTPRFWINAGGYALEDFLVRAACKIQVRRAASAASGSDTAPVFISQKDCFHLIILFDRGIQEWPLVPGREATTMQLEPLGRSRRRFLQTAGAVTRASPMLAGAQTI